MLRTKVFTLSLLLIASSATRAVDVTEKSTLPVARLKALMDEYDEVGGTREFAKRFLALAQEHPRDPAALDALVWVVQKVRNRKETTQALEQLLKHHLKNEKLGSACPDIARAHSTAAEKLLRAALERSPHEKVRAQANLCLASLFELQASVIDQLTAQPEMAARVLQYYGNEYGKHLASLSSPQLDTNRERIYSQMLEEFGDVETADGTMGQLAKQSLFRIRHLSVGKVAPEVQGEDIFGQKFKLSEYRGKVVMLSFWGHW